MWQVLSRDMAGKAADFILLLGEDDIDKWRDECFIYLWPILPPY
jgi:hypothetical protein